MRLTASRRGFLRMGAMAAGAAVAVRAEAQKSVAPPPDTSYGTATALDAERMRSLAAFTMLTMKSEHPVPFGAEIFNTKTGESLMRAVNAVGAEHDPSAHGEVHTIRLACAKLQSASLKGHTLYTTCEPCPMCMACCLWAGLDRMVYGATIGDAAKYGGQIMIAAAEVDRRATMHTEVVGPVEREACLELFTNPTMQKVLKRWKS